MAVVKAEARVGAATAEVMAAAAKVEARVAVVMVGGMAVVARSSGGDGGGEGWR